MYFEQIMAAGAAGAVEVTDASDFLRILESPAEDVTLIFYRAGSEVARAEKVGAGYSESLDFDKVRFLTTGGGMVRIVTRKGATVGYDRAVGAVNITGTVTTKDENGAFTQGPITVNTATTQLAAASATRRYLLVQNTDATNPIYVTVDGTAATTAKGVKLNPGQSLEFPSRAPTGQINAIATGAAVQAVVVEG